MVCFMYHKVILWLQKELQGNIGKEAVKVDQSPISMIMIMQFVRILIHSKFIEGFNICFRRIFLTVGQGINRIENSLNKHTLMLSNGLRSRNIKISGKSSCILIYIYISINIHILNTYVHMLQFTKERMNAIISSDQNEDLN